MTVEEFSNNIYRLETKDPNILRIGDIVELTDDNLTKRPNDLVVTDVYSATVCLVRGSGVGDPAKIIKVGKRLTKFKSDLFAGLESFNANILNTYVDEDKVLIAANSLPPIWILKLDPIAKNLLFQELLI